MSPIDLLFDVNLLIVWFNTLYFLGFEVARLSVAVLFPLSIPDFEDGLFSELLILNLFLCGDKSWAWVGTGGLGKMTVLRLTAEVLG